MEKVFSLFVSLQRKKATQNFYSFGKFQTKNTENKFFLLSTPPRKPYIRYDLLQLKKNYIFTETWI